MSAWMIRVFAVFAALCGTALPAIAQGTDMAFGSGTQDTDAPVEISADSLAVDQSDGTALYTGNVVIIQGEMRLAAPRVLVVYSEAENRIDRMEATGGVILVSGDEAAEAARADYDVENGNIVMSGDVLMTQGANAMTSERVVVNLDDGTARMAGRVRTVIDQGNN